MYVYIARCFKFILSYTVSPGPAVLPELPDLPTPKSSPSKQDLTPRKDAPSLSSLTKRPPSLVKSPSWPKSATLAVGRKKSLSQVRLYACCRETEYFACTYVHASVCECIYRLAVHMHTHLHTQHTHMHAHTHMRARMHTHTDTHTQHTHTCACM